MIKTQVHITPVPNLVLTIKNPFKMKVCKSWSRSQWLFALLAQFLYLNSTFSSASAENVPCPPADLIAPCVCLDPSPQFFRCIGEEITQSTINQLFSTVRTLNNLTTTEWMEMHSFRIGETALLSLDLSALLYGRFFEIFVEFNPYLHTINFEAQNPGQIETLRLHLDYNALTDQGIGQSLTKFTDKMDTIHINTNFITGGQYEVGDGSGDIEFLPGFSQFTNLDLVTFTDNPIRSLGGGQFKRNGRIRLLTFSLCEIDTLNENAMLINPPADLDLTIERSVSFGFNKLTDDRVHPNHGLDSWPPGTEAQFDFFNEFEFLSQEKWEHFLTASNHSNKLDFSSNKFFCDYRMEWLREGRLDYEGRVDGVNCENDYGHTIFNTQLDFTKPQFKCPATASIAPCTCDSITSQLHIFVCAGSNVTQSHIDNLFSIFRSSNNVSETEWINVDLLKIEETDLTQLDLSPLVYGSFAKILVQNNPHLKTIVKSSQNSVQIEATWLSFTFNALTDEGLGNILTHFSPNFLTILDLNNNQLTGGQFSLGDGSDDIELLQGLSQLTSLQKLSLAFNNIVVLGGGQFKRVGVNMTWLDLSDNGMMQLDENALFIDQALEDDQKNQNRFIRLAYNQLTQDTINVNHGLDSWSGQIVVDLNYNQFQFLEQVNWEPFLLGNEGTNVISFFANQFNCDERMKYLKDGKDDFEPRVRFVDCLNDPGHTIFTTDLV